MTDRGLLPTPFNGEQVRAMQSPRIRCQICNRMNHSAIDCFYLYDNVPEQ